MHSLAMIIRTALLALLVLTRVTCFLLQSMNINHHPGCHQSRRLPFSRSASERESYSVSQIRSLIPYDHFQQTIVQLQQQHDSNAVSIVFDDQPDDDRDVVLINSLVFEVIGSKTYVLAILASKDKVDVSALEESLAQELSQTDERLRLQLAGNAQDLCGFAPGTVPPLGLTPAPLFTVVEESLEKSQVQRLKGGGGTLGRSCQISLELLLQQPSVRVGSFRKEEQMISSQGINGNHPETPKPFFVVEPPDTALAQRFLQQEPSSSMPNPFSPVPVSVVGRVSGVRRMAKSLVFCDLAPVNDNCLDDDHPWRSPLNGGDESMAVQLIAGKTLVQDLGQAAAVEAFRSLKSGQLVLVHGQTNVQSRDSLQNWVRKQSLDIVVHSFQILQQEEHETKVAVRPRPQSSVLGKRVPWRPTPGLSYLTLNELYPKGSPPIVVDSMDTVQQFAQDLSQLQPEDRLIGMDCEWMPSFYLQSPSQPQPVLLLQISFHSLQKVYLFDMQTLVRPLLPASEPLTALETALANTLGDLLSSKHYIKVGFQLAHDCRQLAASYPHMSIFQTVHAVVDASVVAKKVMHIHKQRNTRSATSSLSRLSETFLGKGLSKDQQCSDWSLRPLTQDQIEYAALDAVVTPVIVEKLLQEVEAVLFAQPPTQVGRWVDDKSFANVVMSWRFVFLKDHTHVRAIRKLNAKRVVGDAFVVTQRWPTHEDPPLLPSVPEFGVSEPYTDRSGIIRYPSQSVSLKAGSFHRIMDSMVGNYAGRSKERCILPFLFEAAGLPEKSRLDFPQRSGCIEMENALFLFVNIPSSPGRRKPRNFPNEWTQDGRLLTWFIRESEWKTGTSALAQKLKATGDTNDPTLVSLFVRVDKGSFLCCGRCRVSELNSDINSRTDGAKGVDEDWNLVTLNLVLLDWIQLNSLPDFQDLVNPGM